MINKRNIILAAALAVMTLTTVALVNTDNSTNVKTEATTTVTQPTGPTTSAKATKEIVQLSANKDRAVFIFGEIQNTSDVVSKIYALDKTPGRILVVLDSPGGSVLDGAKVISAMEGAHNPVDTINVGLCASMCAIIHSYGTIRYASDRSVLMYHDYAGGIQGYGAHMKSQLSMIDRYTQKFAAHIAERASITLDSFYLGMLKQIWVDAEDATALHFNDAIASVDVNSLLPKDFAARAALEKQLEDAKKEFKDLYELN